MGLHNHVHNNEKQFCPHLPSMLTKNVEELAISHPKHYVHGILLIGQSSPTMFLTIFHSLNVLHIIFSMSSMINNFQSKSSVLKRGSEIKDWINPSFVLSLI